MSHIKGLEQAFRMYDSYTLFCIKANPFWSILNSRLMDDTRIVTQNLGKNQNSCLSCNRYDHISLLKKEIMRLVCLGAFSERETSSGGRKKRGVVTSYIRFRFWVVLWPLPHISPPFCVCNHNLFIGEKKFIIFNCLVPKQTWWPSKSKHKLVPQLLFFRIWSFANFNSSYFFFVFWIFWKRVTSTST
jgi:hypothetical protein